MNTTNAVVAGVNGNMVTARFEGTVRMNAVAYVILPTATEELRLKAEVIRIRSNECDMQVFEDTRGLKVGMAIEISDELLALELGPGLLSLVTDGLGNPLEKLAKHSGYFLQRGVYLPTLDREREWSFTPTARIGDRLRAGHALGTVPEGPFNHRITIPFGISGEVEVLELAPAGNFRVDRTVARIGLENGEERGVTMVQLWPVKKPIRAYAERLLPSKPLTTRVRIVDTFFPIAEGGTACIPGPFGAGKTVLQQEMSRFGDADVVIVAACGERAGEVVETLREFPELLDPRTGRTLMERTIIICNTSSMPVAAREASVYTAITMAEYYRQMGLRVLLLADSTSRWAQALREMSGRLEEIPGEEAFPAYLGSLIASFYERAGLVQLDDPHLGKSTGSVTVVGTVSPAGGNFEEPVTQSTLAVVGCFLGLTYARSYAKRFPAISPLESWSKYLDTLKDELETVYGADWINSVKAMANHYAEGQRIGDQMKVIGEEELTLEMFVHYLKTELFDATFLQQNAFSDVDANPSVDRVAFCFNMAKRIVDHPFQFPNKAEARDVLLNLTSLFRNWNLAAPDSDDYSRFLGEIDAVLAEWGAATEVGV